MYKKFSEMSDEEQGYLLLSHHRGIPIEMLSKVKEIWEVKEKPSFCPDMIYRVKEVPEVRLISAVRKVLKYKSGNSLALDRAIDLLEQEVNSFYR
tara:strand:+ start:896 stop:1180 length:285 start_codon:yes stop_codon:yes gene_type:complete